MKSSAYKYTMHVELHDLYKNWTPLLKSIVI